MNYDLFATYPCISKQNVDLLLQNNNLDLATYITLLSSASAFPVKDYARTGDRQSQGYKGLVFSRNAEQSPYAQKIIRTAKKHLQELNLWQPSVPPLEILPKYTLFLQFLFTLSRPYISKDDEAFHINDNPVRKDKIFKVPMVGSSSWKGNLRWTVSHLLAIRFQETKNHEELAERRFRSVLLFGDEIGEKEKQGLAKYLDNLSKDAASLYRQKLKAHWGSEVQESIVSHAGYLRFYPTFFDLIGLEVINPHDRETKTGKMPLYFESVPAGGKGTFSLLYAPFDGVTKTVAQHDLTLITEAISQMMLIYGFSAKKSAGFGEAKPEIANGKIVTGKKSYPLSNLRHLQRVASQIEWF